MVKHLIPFRPLRLPLFTMTLVIGLSVAGCSSGPKMMFADDPEVVAEIAGSPISFTELEEQYRRTSGLVDTSGTVESYEDFLQRYVDFKLKVREARRIGLDKDPEVVNEILTYRGRFARPYLLEHNVIEPITQLLYNRRSEMVHASHILLRVREGDDTTAVRNRMVLIVDSIKAGTDFGDMAVRHSEDPTAANPARPTGYKGNLGFFSGGRMVQPFEDWAYMTSPGSMSPIFRTRFGYHVLQVHERRPAIPEVRVSHLMTAPTNPTAADSLAALENIQSLRDSILAGADFATIARRHSADGSSAPKGGDLGYIAYDGRLLPELKDPLFDLENVGDITEVIQTRFGNHVLQLTDRKALPTYDELYEELKKQALALPRMKTEERKFALGVLDERGASYDTLKVRDLFVAVPKDSVGKIIREMQFSEDEMQIPIAMVGDSTFTVNHLVNTMRFQQFDTSVTKDSLLSKIMDDFMVQKAIDYEVAALEETDESFAVTMSDFRDGLVLFKLMEDSVWNAASSDSLALLERYNANPQSYRYPDRTIVVSFFGRDSEALASYVETLMTTGTAPVPDTSATTGSVDQIRTDTTRIAGTSNSIFDSALELGQGEITEPAEYNGGYIILLNDGIDPSRPKTFAEARSELATEFQEELEARLLTRLRRENLAFTYPERLPVLIGLHSTGSH